MLTLAATDVGIAAGLVVIVGGVAAGIRWMKDAARSRRTQLAEREAAEDAEAKRLAQRLCVGKKNHATAELLQTTRARSVVAPWENPWDRTSASGYGEVVRDDLRRSGITPAEYARGRR
jgi:hypothetical protein